MIFEGEIFAKMENNWLKIRLFRSGVEISMKFLVDVRTSKNKKSAIPQEFS